MRHCEIEFEVLQVKFYPVECLEDFFDETERAVIYCPFCGEKVKNQNSN